LRNRDTLKDRIIHNTDAHNIKEGTYVQIYNNTVGRVKVSINIFKNHDSSNKIRFDNRIVLDVKCQIMAYGPKAMQDFCSSREEGV